MQKPTPSSTDAAASAFVCSAFQSSDWRLLFKRPSVIHCAVCAHDSTKSNLEGSGLFRRRITFARAGTTGPGNDEVKTFGSGKVYRFDWLAYCFFNNCGIFSTLKPLVH